MKRIYLDFETDAIEPRHITYPPKPVGLAATGAGIRGEKYFAWGHPTKNNCTKQDAYDFLKKVWYGNTRCVWHNAKFDLEVAHAAFDLPLVPPCGFDDTLPMYVVYNPHARAYGLKPTIEREFSILAEDQKNLHQWIFDNVPGAKKAKTKVGEHISKAPGDLVGYYAKADVRMTKMLFEHVAPKLDEREMAAYQRELTLIPILINYEREGVRVDLERLQSDIAVWSGAMEIVDQWIWKRLKSSGFNVNSGDELAAAILRAEKGDESAWPRTPTGKLQTSKEAIDAACLDEQLIQALAYRSKLKNGLTTFAMPWAEQAEASGGRIFTTWFSSSGDNGGGARTGRMSSRPNFQNVPKTPARLIDMKDKKLAAELYKAEVPYLPMPASLLKSVAPLPVLRDYITADEGGVLIDRDYSQQELRILAHFEDGAMRDAYLNNPRLDFHKTATAMVNAARNASYTRSQVKTVVFGLIYGMGIKKLAASLSLEDHDAKALKYAILDTFPGIRDLNQDLMAIGRGGGKIRTWGGRRYCVEPAAYVDGAYRTFEYKLLNVLIQGSAADCTKQALINYDSHRKNGRVLMIVHDEILASTQEPWQPEMERLRQAMEEVQFDVPMLSDGKANGRTWASLTKVAEAA